MKHKTRFSALSKAAHEKHTANVARIAADQAKREKLADLAPKLAERLIDCALIMRELPTTPREIALAKKIDGLLAEFDAIQKGGA